MERLGMIVNKDTGALFDVYEWPGPFEGSVFAPEGATHVIECYTEKRAGGFGYRAARILKTVAHVAVDEGEGGEVIWEKWPLKYRPSFL